MIVEATRALAALLFMSGMMYCIDIFSAVNSSPWTAENASADDSKYQSLRHYVWIAILLGMAAGIAASIIAGSWWPIIGVTLTNVFMWWLYDRAMKRGRKSQAPQVQGFDPGFAGGS